MKRKVQLVLTVTYDYEDGNEQPPMAICKDLLDHIVIQAAGDGWLSGESDVIVDEYSHAVDDITDDGIELSDGGVIECPDSQDTIRRYDKDGNCEEIRKKGDADWDEWRDLFPQKELTLDDNCDVVVVIDCENKETTNIVACKAFLETPRGNEQAEALFRKWVRESDGEDIANEEELVEIIDNALSDGLYEVGSGYIAIMHTT